MTITTKVQTALKSCDLHRIRERSMARTIGTNRTAMAEKLQGECTTYGRLLDQERKRRCMDLLEINRRPDAALIAKKTGYSHPGAALLAFKRWFGVTLRAWKAGAGMRAGR